MNELLRRLRWFLNRAQFERELDEELRHHAAMKNGDTKQIGNIALLKEDTRAMWTFAFWEQFVQDVRYGVRAMSANKLFTAMAVLSLALGIGANTAIYSFMDAIFMRNLPVRNPQELVILKWRAGGKTPVVHGVNGSMFRDGESGRQSPNFPYLAYVQLRSDKRIFSTLFGHFAASRLNLVARNQADVARGEYVSGEFFSGLGAVPSAGRLISNDDDRPGASSVAVISHDYWQSRFASDPTAVGQTLLINNIPFTIIGVAARGFFGVDSSVNPVVYIPLHTISASAPKPEADYKERFLTPQFYWVEMMGRLEPGVTQTQAQSVISGQFRSYVLSTAGATEDKTSLPSLFVEPGLAGRDSLRREYSRPLYVLMGMVALILTIACANIANLLLARATARRREIAIRLSLGAGRGRVIRQLLTESLLLAFTGGVLGLAVAVWAIRSIIWLLSNGTEQVLRASLNWPVLAFTFLLAAAAGIVFGLVPAVQATGVDVAPVLKEARIGASGGRSRFTLSRALVVSQIAISLLLVVAAGLFVRTLLNLHAVEIGFNDENILLFRLNARQAGYKDNALAQFYEKLTTRFARIPGVRSVGMSDYPLLAYNWDDEELVLPGAAPVDEEKRLSTAVVAVNDTFLPTMQIPILLGRGLTPRDMPSGKTAVVTELFARKFFPNASPLGQRVGLGKNSPADIEIVGVATTTRYNSVKEKETPPVLYIPYTHFPGLGQATFELRMAGDPIVLATVVRRIVHDVNSSVPVSEFKTQAAQIDETISQERTLANLCTCFAALAIIIACVGLYGTMAYAVARRTSEIGIRVALGAQRRLIIWMVLREVCLLAAIGLAIGLTAAWEMSHFVASFLFGVKPNDPASIAFSAAVLIAAAFAAGYAPAWRASRIDPMAALRHE